MIKKIRISFFIILMSYNCYGFKTVKPILAKVCIQKGQNSCVTKLPPVLVGIQLTKSHLCQPPKIPLQYKRDSFGSNEFMKNMQPIKTSHW